MLMQIGRRSQGETARVWNGTSLAVVLFSPSMLPSTSPTDSLQQARNRLGASLLTTGCGGIIFAVPVMFFISVMASLVFEQTDTWVPIVFAVFMLPFVALVVYLAWSALRAVRGIVEISNQHVASSPGEVVWTGRQYAVQAEGLKLHTLPGVELMPGRYAFTYLPGSGFVVDARPTGGADCEAVLTALGGVFKFTPDDLPALRAGQIGPDHRARLQQSKLQGVLGALVGAAIFGGVAIVLALFVNDSEGTGIALCLPAVFIAVVLLIMAAVTGWQSRALDRGEVEAVTGPVREWTSGGRSRSYWFEVGGRRFRVSQAAHTALVQGQTYRIYFLKGLNQILAVEPSESPPNTDTG